jgi:hypothetical protein
VLGQIGTSPGHAELAVSIVEPESKVSLRVAE